MSNEGKKPVPRDPYPVGTVARVRVGGWQGRAARDINCRGDLYWTLLGNQDQGTAYDDEATVFTVELPAPAAEVTAFGARVEHGPEGKRREALLAKPDAPRGWMTRERGWFEWFDWSNLINPVVLHDPEADR